MSPTPLTLCTPPSLLSRSLSSFFLKLSRFFIDCSVKIYINVKNISTPTTQSVSVICHGCGMACPFALSSRFPTDPPPTTTPTTPRQWLTKRTSVLSLPPPPALSHAYVSTPVDSVTPPLTHAFHHRGRPRLTSQSGQRSRAGGQRRVDRLPRGRRGDESVSHVDDS